MPRRRCPLQGAVFGIFSAVFFPLSAASQTPEVRARVTEAVDVQKTVTLHGNVHPLARPKLDRGAAPDNLRMARMLLVLKRGQQQEAELRQLLEDQHVKSSSRYHQWLTPDQFGQQFGPADADLKAVSDWLTAQGFEVDRVARGRNVIEFSGTAGIVRQALHIQIHRLLVNGEERWANLNDPQIPAALAPVVVGFASLNNFPRKPLVHRLGPFLRSKLTRELTPLTTFSLNGGFVFGLGPTDFATIYNVTPLWQAGTDGTGQTVAIVGETNINIQDVRDFRSMFGLPANDPNIILNGPDPGQTGDETEADLDVEWVGAVAKGATVDLVVSESTEATAGIDLSALYIVDNDLAPVMSLSYGACEAEMGTGGNAFYNLLWEQAAAQGITVLVAAGDSGSAGCDAAQLGETAAQHGLGVNGFASTPFNVAVGGTDFDDASSPLTYWNTTNASSTQSSAKSYIPEVTWNDSCAVSGITGCASASSGQYFDLGIDLTAGGGGPSTCLNLTGTSGSFTCSGGYPKPAWQSGLGVPADSARDMPDLSLFAGDGFRSSAFYILCQMDANFAGGGSASSCDLNPPYTDVLAVGGTSASAQAMAAIMALVNQKYGRQGNVNYVLYPLATKSGANCASSAKMAGTANSSACIFYDTIKGNNSVACVGGSPDCSNPVAGGYGVIASGSPLAPVWRTAAGYDLATGLGTVNVANLVNDWNSVTFTPTATTLSLSTPTSTTPPITLTHGQPVNVNIAVSPDPGSGTPSGDASLIAQMSGTQNNGVAQFTLADGAVSSSTNLLPGGSYNVAAHYAGNGTYGASDSAPIAVTVNKESSQTQLGLVTFNLTTGIPSYAAPNAPATVPYGSPYVLRVDVTNSSGKLCAPSHYPATGFPAYPCPTGQVTVTPTPEGLNPGPGYDPGVYTLSVEGYAEDIPIQLSAGSYPFVANYAGDNSYNPSTSPQVPITITKAATTTTVSGIPATAVGGMPSTCCTVTVNTQSNGDGPSGAVQFLLNGSTVLYVGGDVNASHGSATGYASLQVSTSPPNVPFGTSTLAAQYPGDTNYMSSTSAPVTITITDFSLSVSSSGLNITPGQSGALNVTVAPLYGFAGAVSLSCYVPAMPGGTCTVSPAALNLNSSSSSTATLTIATTANSTVGPLTRPRKIPPRLRLPISWPEFGALLLALGLLAGLATARRRAAAWALATSVLWVGAWVACGGGNSATGGADSAPVAVVSPSSLTFRKQLVNSTSSTQTVTVAHTGGDLIVSSATIGGTNGQDFMESVNCGYNAALGPGVTCPLLVAFTPTAAGPRSAVITIVDNASNSPQTVSLNGTGALPPTPAGTYSVLLSATSGADAHSQTVTVNVQ